MSNQNIKNPFTQEDWFSKVVWRDQKVRTASTLSFQKFFKLHLKPNFFMSFKFSIIQTFSKHAVLASLILLLLAGGVGASAAEFLAPENYKLSTFIKKYSQNQQKQKDPFTALSPDNDNFVVSATDCNLAVKYPKKIRNLKTNTDVTAMPSTLNISNTEYINSIGQFRLGIEQNYENQNIQANDISVSCFKKSDYDKLPKNTDAKNQLTKDKFFAETGWFIFEAEIKNFQDITYSGDFYSGSFKYDNKYIGLTDRNVKFEFQDLVYEVGYTTRSLTEKDFDPTDSLLLNEFQQRGELNVPGIFANQIQLQFNSVVTNTFSGDIQTSNSSSTSSSSSNNNSTSSAVGSISKITNYSPKELELPSVDTKNINSAIKVIDGKTYWIEPITGVKSCMQEGDPGNCGNYKLMTIESGKPKTILEFLKDSGLLSLQFLSGQSIDGQLYIYSCSGFGGGCRVDPGILFNPKTGKITKDDKWMRTNGNTTGEEYNQWLKDAIGSKVVNKDYPIYSGAKFWPTVFGNEKYFGVKDGLQYGRVIKTAEFKNGNEPIGGEYWIVANNGKELNYLYKTQLTGKNYEGVYFDTLNINSRGNLVTEIQNDSYVDVNKKTILVDNYTFVEQDLNTGKVIQKTENVLETPITKLLKT